MSSLLRGLGGFHRALVAMALAAGVAAPLAAQAPQPLPSDALFDSTVIK